MRLGSHRPSGPDHALAMDRGSVGLRVTFGFSNEHVPVGEHVQPPRALKAARERRDPEARREVGVRPRRADDEGTDGQTTSHRLGQGRLDPCLASPPTVLASASPVRAKTANRTMKTSKPFLFAA